MNNLSLPYSEACERNKEPIFNILRPIANDKKSLLEVGFGTGQHAWFFSQKLSHLDYFAADREEYHPLFHQREQALGKPENLQGPLHITASDTALLHNLQGKLNDNPKGRVFDLVFSANTLHIMHEKEAELFLKKIPNLIASNGNLLLYGPFNFNGLFTSESNEHFNASLRSRHPGMGIRDFEWVQRILESAGMTFGETHNMPANNFILNFIKSTP